MKGNVIGFDADTNTGAISGHDGRRYDFVTLDWRASKAPRRGDIVDFQAIEQRATEIYLVDPAHVAPSLAQFYFSPRGRISRSQYWLKFMLPYAAIAVVLQIFTQVSGTGNALNVTTSTISGLFGLIALWPSIAVMVKRIHDRNKSAWYLLFLFIPGFLFMIFLVVWLGVAVLTGAMGTDATALPALGSLELLTIASGLVLLGIEIWFFVEFGCLRGTIGANRYGSDPVG